MATRSRTGTAGLPRARTARHDDLPKGHDAVRDSVLDAPDDRHTAARADHPPVTPVLTALPVDVISAGVSSWSRSRSRSAVCCC